MVLTKESSLDGMKRSAISSLRLEDLSAERTLNATKVSEPDSRRGSATQFVQYFVATIGENITNRHRIKSSWSIHLDVFYIVEARGSVLFLRYGLVLGRAWASKTFLPAVRWEINFELCNQQHWGCKRFRKLHHG